MQNLDSDMDDLLRRASDAYPLRQSEDRWAEIESILKVPSKSGQNKFPRQQKTYKVLPVLFTLLFLTISILISERTMISNSLLQGQDKFSYKSNSGKILLQEESKTGVVNPNAVGTIKKTAPGINNVFKTKEEEKINFLHNESESIGISNTLGYKDKTKDTRLNPATPLIQNSRLETNYSQLKTFPDEPANEIELKKIIGEPATVHQDKTATKHVYFGVTAALNFSTVKNSGLSKSGYSLGLLAGYRFTRSISLESGLSYSRKLYSSKGAYFDMNEMGNSMPSGMQIMEVDGSNHVIEIPLHLKYDFYPGKQPQFFSTIGFSSYLMTQEKNQYDLMVNGAAQKMTGTYKNNRQYMAASLDLSIGYENRLGPVSVRIEPYIQIPLKGVGIGKLPVTSLGWRFGLIH